MPLIVASRHDVQLAIPVDKGVWMFHIAGRLSGAIAAICFEFMIAPPIGAGFELPVCRIWRRGRRRAIEFVAPDQLFGMLLRMRDFWKKHEYSAQNYQPALAYHSLWNLGNRRIREIFHLLGVECILSVCSYTLQQRISSAKNLSPRWWTASIAACVRMRFWDPSLRRKSATSGSLILRPCARSGRH